MTAMGNNIINFPTQLMMKMNACASYRFIAVRACYQLTKQQKNITSRITYTNHAQQEINRVAFRKDFTVFYDSINTINTDKASPCEKLSVSVSVSGFIPHHRCH